MEFQGNDKNQNQNEAKLQQKFLHHSDNNLRKSSTRDSNKSSCSGSDQNSNNDSKSNNNDNKDYKKFKLKFCYCHCCFNCRTSASFASTGSGGGDDDSTNIKAFNDDADDIVNLELPQNEQQQQSNLNKTTDSKENQTEVEKEKHPELKSEFDDGDNDNDYDNDDDNDNNNANFDKINRKKSEITFSNWNQNYLKNVQSKKKFSLQIPTNSTTITNKTDEIATISATKIAMKQEKRKSFEVKNLWFYLRNNGPPSPQQQPTTIKTNQFKRNSNSSSSTKLVMFAPENTDTQATTTPASFSARFFNRSTSSPSKCKNQRNSSIPENVFLGLRTTEFDGSNQSSQQHLNRCNKEPRHSVPTIIQKDKAQKTWEKMMVLKNSEKKNKRKNSRMLAAAAGATTSIASSSSSVQEHSDRSIKLQQLQLLQQEQEQPTKKSKENLNVVIIIDDSSPTRDFNVDDDKKEYNPIKTLEKQSNSSSPSSEMESAIVQRKEVDVFDVENCHLTKSTEVANSTINDSTVITDNNNNQENSSIQNTEVFDYLNHQNHCHCPQQQQQQEQKPKIMSTVDSIVNAIPEKKHSVMKQIETKEIMIDPFDDDVDVMTTSSKNVMADDSTTTIASANNNNDKSRQSTDVTIGTEKQQQPHPESCSSYSSLNNDDAINNSNTSLPFSQEDGDESAVGGIDVLNSIDPRLVRDCLQQAVRDNGNSNQKSSEKPIAPNYQRKYSLAVPGEPRYMHHHHHNHQQQNHRRESSAGSRSPLNSSCGGLSPSELSTPSCSNSMIDDQSSYSSHSIHDAIILEHSTDRKHCTLSVDSLFLKTAIQNDLQITNNEDDDEDDDVVGIFEQKNRILLEQQDNNSQISANTTIINSNASGGSVTTHRKTHHRLVDELCKSFIHLKTSSNKNKNNGTTNLPNASSFNDFGSTTKSANHIKKGGGKSIELETSIDKKMIDKPRKRKNSVTAILASLLLPESICERIGCNTNNPHWTEEDNENDQSSCDRKSSNNQKWDNNYFNNNKSAICDQLSSPTTITTMEDLEIVTTDITKKGNNNNNNGAVPLSSSSSPPPSSNRKRKGSIAQITQASATRIVRLLRRTHSAGNSKDAPPSYALFLGGSSNNSNKSRSNGHHHKSKSKSRKRRLKDNSSIMGKSSTTSNGSKRRTQCDSGGKHQKYQNQQQQQQSSPQHHLTSMPQSGNSLEEMKQRLRFLNRRHTDSSLHSSTVRPSKDEVEKWSKSFRDLMANRYGSALFRAFLCREYSDENIEFWLACEEYRKIRSSKLRHKAKKIYDNYVAVRSPREVNLDHQLRSDIQKNLATASKFTFDEAQKKIQSLLESDSYVRFLQSDLYTDLAMCELKRQNKHSPTLSITDGSSPTQQQQREDNCDNNKISSSSRRQSKDSQSQSTSMSPPSSPFNT